MRDAITFALHGTPGLLAFVIYENPETGLVRIVGHGDADPEDIRARVEPVLPMAVLLEVKVEP